MVCLLAVGVLSILLVPAAANAQQRGPGPGSGNNSGGGCGSSTLLGFPAWYHGLTKTGNGGSCDIKSPTELDGGVSAFIWIIVFNIVEMILRLAGYAAVAFIIYGGYKYITSAGSADGTAAAKKTITNAVIGLVISIAAVAIVRTVSVGLGLIG